MTNPPYRVGELLTGTPTYGDPRRVAGRIIRLTTFGEPIVRVIAGDPNEIAMLRNITRIDRHPTGPPAATATLLTTIRLALYIEELAHRRGTTPLFALTTA